MKSLRPVAIRAIARCGYCSARPELPGAAHVNTPCRLEPNIRRTKHQGRNAARRNARAALRPLVAPLAARGADDVGLQVTTYGLRVVDVAKGGTVAGTVRAKTESWMLSGVELSSSRNSQSVPDPP